MTSPTPSALLSSRITSPPPSTDSPSEHCCSFSPKQTPRLHLQKTSSTALMLGGADELEGVLKLFHRHAQDPELHVRHTAALAKLSQQGSRSGFPVRDLPRITDILNSTLDLVAGPHSHVFVEPACSLIRALGRPYLKQKSTDELRLLSVVSDLLRAVARVFTQQLPVQLQTCAAEVLEAFASVWGNRPAVPMPSCQQSVAELDLQSVQRIYHTHHSILYDSEVVTAACQALQQVAAVAAAETQQRSGCSTMPQMRAAVSAGGTQPADQQSGQDTQQQQQQQQQQPAHVNADAVKLAAALTSALLEFSLSPQLCEQQLQAGVLPVLAELLQPEAEAGMGSQLSMQVLQLLWNLFEHAADAANQAAAPSDDSHQHAPTTQEQLQQDNPDALCPGGLQEQPSVQDCADHPTSHVTQQLVDVLSLALDQQMASCSSLQRQQQRNDTLTVLSLMSTCSSFAPAMAGSSRLMQRLLVAAGPQPLGGQPVRLAAAAAGTSSTDTSTTPGTSNSSCLNADHSMQLLAWSILGDVAARVSNAVPIFAEAGPLQMLLDAVAFGVSGACADAASAAWFGRLAPEQLSASQQLAWSILQQVGPLCKVGFISRRGITVLLECLTACSNSSSTLGTCSGTGAGLKSPNRTGCRSPGAETAVLTGSSCSSAGPVLRLLRALLQDDAGMAAAVVEAGGVSVLLQLLQAPAAATLTAVRQGVLLCLSQLCSAGGRPCVRAVRQARGVELLLKECQSHLDGDAYVPSLAALDALWRCCIVSQRSRALLLAADGMDTLLSLLHRGNPALRSVLLSLLADLLEDRRAHGFFWEWHAPTAAGGSGWSSSSSSFSIPRARPASGTAASSAAGALLLEGSAGSTTAAAAAAKASLTAAVNSDQPVSWLLGCYGKGTHTLSSGGSGRSITTSAQLLVSIWRQQDEALGITGPDGILANPSRPLSGSYRRPGGRVTASAGPGPHVDAYGLMLPGRQAVLEQITQAGSPHSLMEKVYACFAALGVAGSQDSSGVSSEGLAALQQLPAPDLATLAVIQQYSAFRQGEVWQDIKAGFSSASLQVTQEDSARLASGIKQAAAVAGQVQAAQAALLGAAASHHKAIESMMYDNMAAQAAADARAKVYEKDCSKLTMRERLAAKARKEDMLKMSRRV